MDVVIAHTEMKKRATLSWSGGKDSAFALHQCLTKNEVEVVGLHTIINAETRRVGMHGVREELIEMQAASLGIPLTKIYTTASQSHEPYEDAMNAFFAKAKREEIDVVVYGDIFLEDLRIYREKLLHPFRLESAYPLWQLDTTALVNEFITLGFKTALCVVDQAGYNYGLLGRTIDSEFIQALPPGTDPCGEKGEFHTLVYDGPIFGKQIHIRHGDIFHKTYEFNIINAEGRTEVRKSIFWFQDFLAGHGGSENQPM